MSSALCLGTGWPAWIKMRPRATHLQALHEKATRLSLEFSRNIQEGGKTIVATQSSWRGCRTTTWRATSRTPTGQITLTTDQPDMQPVMTFAASAALRERMFLAYNTRAYPANQQILLDLLATRQEIATILGFRSWADLATADQMMGSAANVRTFSGEAECGEPGRRRREHELIMKFARERQPGLAEIDITSRGYWYEQFRRADVRLRLAVGAAILPVCAGGSGRAGDSGAAVQGGVSADRTRRHGTRTFRSSRCSRADNASADSISICIRARARTSGFRRPRL